MDDKIIIRNEAELSKWFVNNHKKLGYSKIIRKDIGKFPDFIMLKNKKEVLVELETLSSNFILHNHDEKKVDEIICIKNDIENNVLKIPIIELNNLKYAPRIRRVSATIDPTTDKMLDSLLKKWHYRNKSHVIEEAIKFFAKRVGEKK